MNMYKRLVLRPAECRGKRDGVGFTDLLDLVSERFQMRHWSLVIGIGVDTAASGPCNVGVGLEVWGRGGCHESERRSGPTSSRWPASIKSDALALSSSPGNLRRGLRGQKFLMILTLVA